MKLTLKRNQSANNATIGVLYLDDIFECYTLEDVVREITGIPIEQWKIKGQTAIPIGKYRVIIDFSNRFQKMMPHILDVAGFEGVRIHSGNSDKDTEGCLLVGQCWKIGENKIGLSRLAFESLFIKLEKAVNSGEEIYLTVE